MSLLLGYIAGGVIVIILFCVLIYVIQALAWQRVFNLCGHYHPWAAWVPFYNFIVMCECCNADDVDLIGPIHIPMNVFKWWWAPMCVVWLIPFIGPWVFIIGTYLALGWQYMMIFANVRGTSPQEEMMCGYMCAILAPVLYVILFKIEPIPME